MYSSNEVLIFKSPMPLAEIQLNDPSKTRLRLFDNNYKDEEITLLFDALSTNPHNLSLLMLFSSS